MRFVSVALGTFFLSIALDAQTVLGPNSTTTISGKTASSTSYKFTVPANINTALEVTTGGGTGDCDLYLRKGAPASQSSWTAKSAGSGSAESIRIENDVAGDWYLLVRAGTGSYANVKLTIALTGRRWDFNDVGSWFAPPQGWVDGSQGTIHPNPKTLTGYGVRDNVLLFGTEANGTDRYKVLTSSTFRLGTFEWRLWVPPINGADAQTGGTIGAFLYAGKTASFPDGMNEPRQEIDVEIGWGTGADRTRLKVAPQQIIAYYIVHPFGAEKGDNAAPLGMPVDPGNWYTFRITTVPSRTNTIDVCWQYAKNSAPFSACSSQTTYSTKYPVATDFYIFASLENNPWSAFDGKTPPPKPRMTKFDWIAFRP